MPKILVVEDHDDSLDVIKTRLERRGFEVLSAKNGRDGVALAVAERPDLVLMDMNLPEVDGWEATRQIKAAPGLAMTPVIAITAHAMEGDRERALAAGCVEFLRKPVDFGVLIEQVETFLRQSTRTPT